MFRLLAAFLLLVLLAGCGAADPVDSGPAREITVELGTNEEFKFSPDKMALKVGEPVALTLKNVSTVVHDLSIEDLPVKGEFAVEGAENHASGSGLDIDLDPGKSAVVRFTPSKAGTYQAVCEQPGHTEGGMVMTFEVTDG